MTPSIMALPGPVLVAAGMDWLEAVLPLLFVGFWILSQVMALFRRVAGGPGRPPVIALPDQQGARPRPPRLPDPDPRAELERQISDFLRQVNGESDRPEARQGGVRGVARDGKPMREQRGLPANAPRPHVASPPPREDGMATRPIGMLEAESTSVARHVREVFAHDVGSLHAAPDTASDRTGHEAGSHRSQQPGVSTGDLIRAVRDPRSIRDAILLREILERPEGRW